MKLHLLLTDDIAPTMPDTCKIIHDFGRLVVKFDDDTKKEGLHCVVEDETENIKTWLKPFDGIVVGSGVPQFEKFSIQHIK